jgi:hypothetical protein
VLEDPTPRAAAAVALKLFPELTLAHPELALLRDELVLRGPAVRSRDRVRQAHRAARPWSRRLAPTTSSFYEFQDARPRLRLTDVLREHGGAYIGWSAASARRSAPAR